MQFLKILSNFFRRSPTDKMVRERREKAVCGILSRYSEGNIYLNRGRYISADRARDIKKKAVSLTIK